MIFSVVSQRERGRKAEQSIVLVNVVLSRKPTNTEYFRPKQKKRRIGMCG